MTIVKVFLKEGLILLGLFIVSKFVLGFNTGESIDIQLHDTYYVFSAPEFSALLFLLMIYLVYLIRQIIKKFKPTMPNFILLITTVLLMAMTIIFLEPFSDINAYTGGWVIYPPLSALPQEYDTKTDDYLKISFVTIQLIFVLTILVVSRQLWREFRR